MYEVVFTDKAAKKFKKLPNDIRIKIRTAVTKLSKNPYESTNVKKLHGEEGYRLRVGDYRIIYEIINNKLVILVLDVGHRKEIYR